MSEVNGVKVTAFTAFTNLILYIGADSYTHFIAPNAFMQASGLSRV